MLAGNAEHSGDHHPDDVPNSSGHPGLLEHSFDNDSADESLIQPALSLDQDNDNKITISSNEDQESDLVSSDPEEASGDGEVISVVEAGEDVLKDGGRIKSKLRNRDFCLDEKTACITGQVVNVELPLKDLVLFPF